MKIKTSELTGAALDWAVAISGAPGTDGLEWGAPKPGLGVGFYMDEKEKVIACFICGGGPSRQFKVGRELTVMGVAPIHYSPSANWSQGGPIIEQERMYLDAPGPNGEGGWTATRFRERRHEGVGPTVLIAAMRCFVASKLGNEVDIPEELLK